MVFGLDSIGSMIFYVAIFIVISSIKIINEYETGVLFTLGKFSGTLQPGLKLVVPFIQTWVKVDMRVKAIDVPDQDAITKDNVSIKVNAVLFYKVIAAKDAIIKVEDYMYAVSQLSQTTMRDVVGEVSLDELLSKRDSISKRIKEIVDKLTDPWGIKVESVELKHVELPADLKRVIGKEAEAEREKRAVIIKAQGEVSTREYSSHFNIGYKTAQRHLAKIKELGLITDNGEDINSPNYRYVIA